MSPRGLMLAAPSSGAGKTTVTLALLRAFRRSGMDVRAAKSGPDYIDPAFHTAACGHASVNLDAWAMDANSLRARAIAQGGDLLLVEAAMGVLDGAADGTGSAADLAAILGIPIVLIVDAARQGPSTALAAAGFRVLRPDIPLSGVILNRIGSPRHEALARSGLDSIGMPVLGSLARDAALRLPARHLGLVQAGETEALDAFLDMAAALLVAGTDLDRLANLAKPLATADRVKALPPPGQRIAIARDHAFAFAYPHLLADWQAQGASLHLFSPLADEAPDTDADAIFLPGGYPELHARTLTRAKRFRSGMTHAALAGTLIYGECGGYMTLGEAIIDAEGVAHPMLGLLPVTTNFMTRGLTLGYRRVTALPGAAWSGAFMGHEFHYASIDAEGAAARLFSVTDAAFAPGPDLGLRRGRVMGSFIHLIAPA
ncbi:MAG: cobyrinate a,c-diamide synthase [Pseudomonadota bacterium]